MHNFLRQSTTFRAGVTFVQLEIMRAIFYFAISFWCCGLGGAVKSNADDRQFRMLTRQLRSIKGAKVCNLFVQDNINSRALDRLQVHLSRSFPTVSMKKFKLKSSKFTRVDFGSQKNFYQRKREQVGLSNYASGNAILIYVYQRKNTKQFTANVLRIYRTLAFSTSLPKLLLISLTDSKQKSYKSTFNFLMKNGRIVDVEILELSNKVKSLKKGLKSNLHTFVVHAYNPFTKQYSKRKLSKRISWFRSKVNNLHGYKLFTNYEKPKNLSYVINNKTLILQYDKRNHKSRLGVSLKTSMNFTYSYAKRLSDQDIFFRTVECDAYSKHIKLKPCVFYSIQIYAPVIYDTYCQVNLVQFILFLPLMLAISIFIRICSAAGKFNAYTWSTINVYKMLLGQSNSSGITFSKLESVLLCLIFFTGFFFSNELSEAATGILNPVTIERQFHRFSDLKDSNLTLYVTDHSARFRRDCGIVELEFLRANLTYRCVNRSGGVVEAVARVFSSTRAAMGLVEAPEVVPFLRDRYNFEGKEIVKKSHLSVYKAVWSYVVKDFNPYYEKMSEIYWRFVESGDHIWGGEKTTWTPHIDKHMFDSYLKRGETDPDEDSYETIDDSFVYVALSVLILGLLASIFALLIEILIGKHKKNQVESFEIELENSLILLSVEYTPYENEERSNDTYSLQDTTEGIYKQSYVVRNRRNTI